MRTTVRATSWAMFTVAGLTLGLGAAPAVPAAPQAATQPSAAPTLSADEAREGFRLLFDGTTKGWRQLGGKTFPAGWDVQDGSLHHVKGGGGGDITVDETFDNFELRFDFKVPPDGNSGIKYRVVEQPNNRAALGVEYQVVDPLSARADNKGKHALGSIYELVAASNAPEPRPAGQWNQGKIIVKGNLFQHWLNGVKVAEIEYGSDAWKTAFAASKWARTNPDFASRPKGNIILQDHTDEVWFRNIRIKVLKVD